MEANILVVSCAVLLYGVFGGRLRGTWLTMPMLFTGAGLLLGPHVLGVLDVSLENETVSALAEATLVIVLFTDASRMHLRTVLREHSLALRLLAIGLPLAIVIGAPLAMGLLPGVPLASAALIAAALAPTDAALGQSFVQNRQVPSRIRQTLNVESGLNDGLAVPFVTVLIDIARHEASSVGSYVVLFLQLVGVGVAVGAAAGWAGGELLKLGHRRRWASETTQRLATVSIAGVAYAASELLGGNGFVAAFSAGLVVGSTARSLLGHTAAFAEAEGRLLALLTFLFFGAVMVGSIAGDVQWRFVAYGVLSLVLVRPLAVAVALLGSRVRWPTVAFIGWAGPRGLASIVYGVLIASAVGVPARDEAFLVIGTTIVLSIYLHGVTAAGASRWYARRISSVPESAEEREQVERLPTHGGRPHDIPDPGS